MDRDVWTQFFNNLDASPFEGERLRAELEHTSIERLLERDDAVVLRQGPVREQLLKVRMNQSILRNTVLAAYNNTCCITGIQQRDLLIAGHNKALAFRSKEPQNGVALNTLPDKAFECGYLTITPDLVINISPLLLNQKADVSKDCFSKHDNQKTIPPSRFLPDIEFLKYHNQERFKLQCQ